MAGHVWYECTTSGCERGLLTGDALHRTSPKGGRFEGQCTEHFEGVPDPIAVIIEDDNARCSGDSHVMPHRGCILR